MTTGIFSVPHAWSTALQTVISSPQTEYLLNFLDAEQCAGKQIYPAKANWLRSLELVAPADVKAVILGQDPYHGPDQAHGLSFSVPVGIKIPPSLRNIFKELSRESGKASPVHGNLENWARQGVLLLNSVLTVEAGQAGSHQGRGWELLTDAIVSHTGRAGAYPSAFLLWGSHAQKKAPLIDEKQHLILQAPHPSPLSAHRGFLGCGHFSKANQWLTGNGRDRVNWI